MIQMVENTNILPCGARQHLGHLSTTTTEIARSTMNKSSATVNKTLRAADDHASTPPHPWACGLQAGIAPASRPDLIAMRR
jgi:hypothetical protein